MRPLQEVAADLGLLPQDVYLWGPGCAKIHLEALNRPRKGHLVLMTAMSPSPAGIGKTTVAIALTDALRRRQVSAAVCLREPSLGPVFGMKGGATGGGQAQLVPSERINLHFTGDSHAVTTAHNLLSAAMDNHMHFGNTLALDPRRLSWPRVQELSDRSLRKVVVGLGGPGSGVPREDRFDITAASEIMAVLALACNPEDLRQRLGRIVVGRTAERKPIQARELQVDGALAKLLEEALLPNLVQTREGSPALMHTGPFANLAHGTSSILATHAALQGADFVIQEAGFGADLGGEKFVDLFCPLAEVQPRCAVVLMTLQGLRYHGGIPKERLADPDPQAVRRGLPNALFHLDLVTRFGIPVVPALNQHDSDPPDEIALVLEALASEGYSAAKVRAFQEGGAGTMELAERVLECSQTCALSQFKTFQVPGMDFEERLDTLVREVYGGKDFELSPRAREDLADCARDGVDRLPICVARTPLSLSDDPTAVGVPRGFRIHVREIRLLAGAGFLVPVCGELMTMPGLPRRPNFENYA
ncbi:MAG: formate--tetrahydrofolate ligase [Candidatus Xenobium sp.]|jgi:formate--tetrahydrofolate ligase|nr:formate--tetrahydrofolate ligase [Burkholderiales bacterium]